MAKSFYQKRLEKEAARQKQEQENVEALLAKLEDKPEQVADSKVQVYTEQDMKEAVKSKSMHTAYNVFYDNKRKQFMLVTLNYDLVTQEAKVVKTEPFSDNIVVASRKIAELMSMKLFKREEEV